MRLTIVAVTLHCTGTDCSRVPLHVLLLLLLLLW